MFFARDEEINLFGLRNKNLMLVIHTVQNGQNPRDEQLHLFLDGIDCCLEHSCNMLQ